MRKGFLALGAALGGSMLLPGAASAHGLVGRSDLPIPEWLFGWAAAIVLIVSFLALALLWPKPRLEGAAGDLRRQAEQRPRQRPRQGAKAAVLEARLRPQHRERHEGDHQHHRGRPSEQPVRDRQVLAPDDAVRDLQQH